MRGFRNYVVQASTLLRLIFGGGWGWNMRRVGVFGIGVGEFLLHGPPTSTLLRLIGGVGGEGAGVVA